MYTNTHKHTHTHTQTHTHTNTNTHTQTHTQHAHNTTHIYNQAMNNALQSAAHAAGYCALATCTQAELLRFAQEHGSEQTGILGSFAKLLVSESATGPGGSAAARAAAKLGLDLVVLSHKQNTHAPTNTDEYEQTNACEHMCTAHAPVQTSTNMH